MYLEKKVGKDSNYKLEVLYEDVCARKSPYQILQIHNRG